MVDIYNNQDKLESYIKELFEYHVHESKEITECPHCQYSHFIKYGRYSKGQRYLCKGCNKTFCKTTNTTFYYSKKSKYLWGRYLEEMFLKSTLRESAENLNINLTTAFYWRHKILSSITNQCKNNKLKEEVMFRRLLLKESFKGTSKKGKKREFFMLLGADSRDVICVKPVDYKKWICTEELKQVFNAVLMKTNNINSFGDRNLEMIIKSYKKQNTETINIEELKRILQKYINLILESFNKFKGIATKYILNYFYWDTLFCRKKKYSTVNMIYELAEEEFYIKSKLIKNIKQY